MKRLLLISLAIISASFSFISCEGEEAENNDPKVHVLDKLNETSVATLSETTYKLTASLTGRGYRINMTIGSEGLELIPGDYEIKNEVTEVGDCHLTLNDGRSDLPLKSGKVAIRLTPAGYSVNFTLSGHYEYNFKYEGPLTFSLDFEPSDDTFFIMEGDVTTTNAQYQTVIVPGVRKYAVTVVNAEGKDMAYIEIVGQPGKTLADLVETYDVKSSSTTAGTIIAGGVWWGTGYGSYFVDASGETKYITGGKITLSSLKGTDGVDYYSITGSGLSTTTASGANGSGELKVRYVAEKPLLGTVERDHTITSTYMGRTMKYSIYLPGGYDGVKEFPVLWLLHGYGDDQNSWLDKGALARYADAYERNGGREMIIVTPDGLTEFYIGRYENYFFKELMPDVENKFKVIADAEHRTVAGLSMGGYGSLYYWVKYSELFSYAYPMSPAVDVSGTESLMVGKDKSKLPGLTIETGIQDSTTPLSGITEFHNYLVKEGIDHEFITRDGGHDWKFWQETLPKVLKKSGEVFAE